MPRPTCTVAVVALLLVLPAAAPDGDRESGLGRESMRRRAREIGAQLTLLSEPGDGTVVTVRFRPAK